MIATGSFDVFYIKKTKVSINVCLSEDYDNYLQRNGLYNKFRGNARPYFDKAALPLGSWGLRSQIFKNIWYLILVFHAWYLSSNHCYIRGYPTPYCVVTGGWDDALQ